MQIIYAIKNKLKINWDYVNMHHQKGLSGGLPYARLITKILEFCDIDLKGDPKKKNKTSKECDMIIGATNKNMGILQRQGWYLRT